MGTVATFWTLDEKTNGYAGRFYQKPERNFLTNVIQIFNSCSMNNDQVIGMQEPSSRVALKPNPTITFGFIPIFHIYTNLH